MNHITSQSTRNCLATFLLLVLIILGCSERTARDERKKLFEKYYDESLAQISGRAALMQFDIKLNREMKCLLSKAFDDVAKETNDSKSSSKSKKNARDFIDNFSAEERRKCEFFVAVDNATSPVFASIKNSGKLPEVAYYFVVLDFKGPSSEGEIYNSIKIGLFDNYDECSKCEQIARSIGMPTKSCKAWTPLSN